MPAQSTYRLGGRFHQAARETGRSRSGLLAEALCLWCHGLLPAEYLNERVYLHPDRGYVGDHLGGWLDYHLNDRNQWCLVDDKLVCQTLLSAAGIATPRLLAQCSPSARPLGGGQTVENETELRAFLDRTSYPFFAKPACDGRGQGCLQVSSWEAEAETLRLGNGSSLTFQQLLTAIRQKRPYGRSGYLFQECLRPHLELSRFHSAQPTLRVVSLTTDGVARLYRTVLRMPVGTSMVDSYQSGTNSNLAANVDPDTGRINRVVQGKRWLEEGLHPDTGQTLLHLSVPDFSESVNLVLQGSRLFPGLRFQHWDVALTDSGPVVVEVNVRGDLVFLQRASALPGRDSLIESALAGQTSRLRRLQKMLRLR